MFYLYALLAVVYGAGAGYVGYQYGRLIEAKAQQVAAAGKAGFNVVKKGL